MTSLTAASVPDLRRRGLSYSMIDGLFFAVMVGVSESYLGAFAVELGYGPTELGLLASVPLLAGALSQLASMPLVRLLGSRKRLVVVGALLQALTHVGFMAIAKTHNQDFAALFSVKLLFWVSGSIIAPAWSAWMASLTATTSRERYFAWRSGAIQASLLIAFMGAGLYLGHAESGSKLETFSVLFGIALIARGLSGTAIALQPDPDASAAPIVGELKIRRALSESRWQFVVYLSGLMFGAHLAVPFFTPYMLLDLKLDYPTYASLSAISILVKAIYFPLCHRIAARFGLARLLFWSGLGVALVPALWVIGRDFNSLILAHVVGGIAWAGAEYASFQLLLDSAHAEHRLEFLAIANTLVGVAQVAGAFIGAKLLELFGLSYFDVFLLSTAARAAPLLALLRQRDKLAPRRMRRLFLRVVSVRPGAGAQQRPIFSTEQTPTGKELEAGPPTASP